MDSTVDNVGRLLREEEEEVGKEEARSSGDAQAVPEIGSMQVSSFFFFNFLTLQFPFKDFRLL